jgi:MoxR-like ATPase
MFLPLLSFLPLKTPLNIWVHILCPKQLDRFFMKITLGYPDDREEARMLDRFKGKSPLDELSSVCEGADIIQIQNLVEKVHVDASINDFIVTIAGYTRKHDDVALGASPRASLCLFKAAQAWALYNERDYVIPDDVMQMAPHVLSHRILMKQEASIKKIRVHDVISRALQTAIAEAKQK